MKVFLDANILMYASGRSHPHREPAQRLMTQVAEGTIEAVTDTEVLQELLYRAWSLNVVAQGIAQVEHVIGSMPTVLPVTVEDVLSAKTLLAQQPSIEPRDAIHAAVMLNHGITQLYSYDRHFDLIPGLTRLEP